MIRALADLWATLKGDGIQLDIDEAAALGAPRGETISLWAAMEARHGSALAHVVCLALFLVQWRHCQDQLAGVPMQPVNYLRAMLLLLIFAPGAALVWLLRQLARPAGLCLLVTVICALAAVFVVIGAARAAASLMFVFSR
nr:hypothetical protein [uncultured Acidocella sp.]